MRSEGPTWEMFSSVQFSSVQLLSHVRLFVTPWTTAYQASLSISTSRSPPKPMCIESVISSNHLIFCHPLLLLPSIFPSIRVFSNGSALPIRWPKYWSFSFNLSPSNEHPGLISFRMDWLDLLEIQGTLKSLLQHHSSKASILLCSAFFYLFILLYNIVLVLPYINMNSPQVYPCSPSWTPLPPPPAVPSLWVISVHQPQEPSIMHQLSL